MIDVHIAAEPANDAAVAAQLVELGFTHDNLVARHVSFYKGVPLSSCPLIGLHMTKKYVDEPAALARRSALADMQAAVEILRNHDLVGYAHAETVPAGADLTIKSNHPFSPVTPWPVAPFEPVFSTANKLWDIHISLPVTQLVPALAATMEASGMYSIEVQKIRNGAAINFRVFTIQGVSSPREGRRLFEVLARWFEQANAPYIEMKQETYLGMERVGQPQIVPPTIDTVQYLN